MSATTYSIQNVDLQDRTLWRGDIVTQNEGIVTCEDDIVTQDEGILTCEDDIVTQDEGIVTWGECIVT